MLRDYVSEVMAVMERLPELEPRLDAACDAIVRALRAGKPVLVAGNGGSAADAMHLAAELSGRFEVERPAYNVMALTGNGAVLTALGNDYGFENIFSRQVEAHGVTGGVFIGISTSGASVNVVKAAASASAMGMCVIVLTGQDGGALSRNADIALNAPSDVTAHIQEMHICLYHAMCRMIDERISNE